MFKIHDISNTYVSFPQLFAKGKSFKSVGIGMSRDKYKGLHGNCLIGPCRTNTFILVALLFYKMTWRNIMYYSLAKPFDSLICSVVWLSNCPHPQVICHFIIANTKYLAYHYKRISLRLKRLNHPFRKLCSSQRELSNPWSGVDANSTSNWGRILRSQIYFHCKFSGEPTQIMRRKFIEYLGTDCFHFCWNSCQVLLSAHRIYTKCMKPSSNAQCTDKFI
jgi:hypothetical protein